MGSGVPGNLCKGNAGSSNISSSSALVTLEDSTLEDPVENKDNLEILLEIPENISLELQSALLSLDRRKLFPFCFSLEELAIKKS